MNLPGGLPSPGAPDLGDLHAAIRVLFGWDGDHLHVFRAGGVHYSDPFSSWKRPKANPRNRSRSTRPRSTPYSP